MENARITGTPYDDVFRTLLNDCSHLIIPVINEIFGEHYSGREKISFSPNEHFLNQQDGSEKERITDTSFIIEAEKQKNTIWNARAPQTAVCWSGFLNMTRRSPSTRGKSGKMSSR